MDIINTYSFIVTPSLETITVASLNTSFKAVDGVLFSYDGTYLLKYPENKQDTTYTVPSGVTTIADMAFDMEATPMTSITIPTEVTTISGSTFYYLPAGDEPLIKCYTSSEAHTFAATYGYDYELLDAPTPTPAPTIDPYATATPTPTPEETYSITFSGWAMYSKIVYQNPFYLGGTVESDTSLIMVRVKILKSDGTAEIDKYKVINTKEYDMSSMNDVVKMETLSKGDKLYTYM